MTKPAPAPDDLLAEARPARDRELERQAVPPFRLSDVKRRQRRAAPLVILLLLAWAAGVLAVVILVRPVMVARGVSYGLLILLYLFVSFGVFGYVAVRVFSRLGLRCPYCGATFYYVKDNRGTPSPSAAEDERRCDSCHAVIIGLEA